MIKSALIFRLVLSIACLLICGQIASAQQCNVTWRKADNPRVISGTVTIPANQTVCVEAGVQVQFASNGQLELLGRMVGTGTSTDRITFTSPDVSSSFIVPGTLDLRFADLSVPASVYSNGTFYCHDCNFTRQSSVRFSSSSNKTVDKADRTVTAAATATTNTRFIWFENVVFDSNEAIQSYNASIYGGGFTAVLKNVTFRNRAWCIISNSFLYVENVTSQNSAYDGLSFSGNRLQPIYLNNLSISNSVGAGLVLKEGNFEIGPNVSIQNAEFPVQGNGGLLPGSQVSASGNRNNYIDATAGVQDTIYAPVQAPYVMGGFSGDAEFLPGTRIKLRANAAFSTSSGTTRILGLPDAPVTIEPFNPAQKWLSGQFNSEGDRLEYVTLDGSQLGIVDATSNGATFYIDNSILRNHDRAVSQQSYVFAFLQGNLFTNNGTAIEADSGTRASGKTNPNLFENNTTAASVVFGSNADARYNWWNSPTGPTAPNNPGGTGDKIEGFAQIQPFRTARPDRTDHAPVVRIPHLPFRAALGFYQDVFEAGNKVLLTWNSSDDRQIVKQKILFSPAGNERDRFTLIADNLPASQRSFELVVPSVGFQVSGSDAFVRIVAVDDKGQEGWDEYQVRVPSGEENGNLQITSNVAGQTFLATQEVPLTWTVTAPMLNSSFDAYLILDADHKIIPVGGGNADGVFGTPIMPFVSTDSARFAVAVYGSTNRQKWFYSEPFAIRPDSRWADAPPQIALATPTAGQNFAAGAVVPISWIASDDIALRRFDIQASFDGGRSWATVTENLPATARSYDWQLPTNGGASGDVRVRVIAVDRRFQNTSATRSIVVTLTTNVAPTVQLTAPANNSSVQIGKSVFLTANAADADGSVQRVEFYQSNNSTGIVTTTLVGSDTTAPYQVAWDTEFTGDFTITARAFDNHNASTTSASVTVHVTPVNPAPLPINPPELDLPNDGQNFPVGSNITLRAAPGTGSRPIVRVDFYNGRQLIASDTTAPYEITWNNVAQGRYTLFARTIANNGAEATSKPADITVANVQITRSVLSDFDADRKTDISIWNPTTGNWGIINSSNNSTRTQQWGLGNMGDKPVPGDYDGDGKTDIAVWRESDGRWYILQSSNNGYRADQWGMSGDKPVPADFDGDGKTDLAVFRPSEGRWYILQSSNNGYRADQWGASEDKPAPADYDGDGRADLAVFRPSQAAWYIYQSTNNGFRAQQWGLGTDQPVAADYDGDGKCDVAVWRPSDGYWYVYQSSNGALHAWRWGASGDIVVPGDYDGDGRADAAVWRGAAGAWYVLRSSDGTVIQQNFGTSGDVPVPSASVPN